MHVALIGKIGPAFGSDSRTSYVRLETDRYISRITNLESSPVGRSEAMRISFEQMGAHDDALTAWDESYDATDEFY